jgi:hypothetical protein
MSESSARPGGCDFRHRRQKDRRWQEEDMKETRRTGYSLFGRLMWLPLLTAPISKTAPKVLFVTLLLAAVATVVGGKAAAVKGTLIGWIIGCWIVSLTYKGE